MHEICIEGQGGRLTPAPPIAPRREDDATDDGVPTVRCVHVWLWL